MSGRYSYEDYVANSFLAAEELGPLLNQGGLRLFLGAGASAGFGLPGWRTLIVRILEKDSDAGFIEDSEKRSPADLAALLDELDDGGESYLTAVRKALYRDISPDLTDLLQRSPLLLSVAALMTGSLRGRIDSVVTHNFDDLLEQYLKMLGLVVSSRVTPFQLSTRADVEINYVHGRLSQSAEGGTIQPIVLSDKSYRDKRAEIDGYWSAVVHYGLYSKVGLYLGLSGDDASILDILRRVQKKMPRRIPYNGYWLLTPDAFARNHKKILEVGICPIKFEKEKIPSFLFSVCKHALH